MRRQIRRGETIHANDRRAGLLYVNGELMPMAFEVRRASRLNSAVHIKSYVTDDDGIVCWGPFRAKTCSKAYPSSAVEIEY